jgi:hypothetical protein
VRKERLVDMTKILVYVDVRDHASLIRGPGLDIGIEPVENKRGMSSLLQ